MLVGIFSFLTNTNMKTYIVHLEKGERGFLMRTISHGTHPARALTRARILLLSDDGATDRDIADRLGCSTDTVRAVRRRFCERPTVQEAITDAPRPGKPPTIQPHHEAFVAATCCTPPPSGHAHWTLGALREELLSAHDDLAEISDESIRRMLLAHRLKPWREKNVVHPASHAAVPGADGGRARSVHEASSTRT